MDGQNISVERVMALTGLGRRQVFRLVREGRIPGAVVGRKIVITPGQFEQLQREGIRPERTPEAASFIRRVA